jgi:hypothetical protein
MLLLLLGGAWLWWAGEIVVALRDARLAGPEPTGQSWRWHRALTPAFESWARARRGSDAAANLPLNDIAGTEWPLFGALFYLRATENLDRAWHATPVGGRPATYARGAIDAAADLLADPAQAAWVRTHWGEAYLAQENVFYRMLLIDGLATQARLTGHTPHRALLQAQVANLAAALTAAPDGLLADYPGQTFPADVAAAWHAIRRADAVLGENHRAAATLARRGFVDAMAPDLGLPPYAWFGEHAPEATEVRGCANAWLLLQAPYLWPQQARAWHAAHVQHFWQRGFWLAGYREFAHGSPDDFYADVDSGPVLAGLGMSATVFGFAAARTVGATEQARAIGLELVAASGPLPNGRLLLPRLMSDFSDAPLLGEVAIVYTLSQPRAPGFDAAPEVNSRVPAIVWLALGALTVLGALAIWRGLIRLGAVRSRT